MVEPVISLDGQGKRFGRIIAVNGIFMVAGGADMRREEEVGRLRSGRLPSDVLWSVAVLYERALDDGQ
jgi:hypothetical protein